MTDRVTRVQAHNKAFESLQWLKHNCNANAISALKKRDNVIENITAYFNLMEAKVKELEDAAKRLV